MPVHTSTAPLAADALNRDEERSFDPSKLTWLVEVLTGHQQGTRHVLTARAVVGNAPDADVVLSDATVSRKHALLEPSAQGVWVKDLGSKNGTFLQGHRVEGFVVRREATFTLGTTLLRISGTPGDQPTAPTSFGEALGTSEGMRALFASLARVAPTSSSVLLLGETGTGKELLARALHAASPRRHRPFVVVDCATLAPSLAESELFGHVKGSFTGADVNRTGAFGSADGGTIFLDEIGELPLELQPRLLRVLEARTMRSVGDDAEQPVDVRVVAATHRDLLAEAKSGRFREDLYFRLAVVVARIPALRERREDLPLLAQSILGKLGRPDFELSSGLLGKLQHHAWPGNVRELRNVIERAVSGSPVVLDQASGEAGGGQRSFKEEKEALVEAFTREYFTRLYEESGGSVAEVARRAGIARTYAHEVLKKCGLKG